MPRPNNLSRGLPTCLHFVHNRGVEVRIDREGTILLLSLHGAVDITSTPQLRRQLAELLTHASPKLIIDLADVPYIDSYGLGVIVEALKQARRAGGDIRVCAPQSDVRTILDMAGLSNHIAIAPSRASALASWKAEASPK
jgi:anti-anti-sigma factor